MSELTISDKLAKFSSLTLNIDDPLHWTTAEGIKVTLVKDPKNPGLALMKTDHAFHILKLFYNAFVNEGLIKTDLVRYSVFSRNINPDYLRSKEGQKKAAYTMIRLINEIGKRGDLQYKYKPYFEQIVENLYDTFISKKSKLNKAELEQIKLNAPRTAF